MENAQRLLKKLKIELLYDPAIPLLGIYSEKTILRKDTCTPMFIAALNPCTYGQLIYKKKLRIYNGEKTGSSISGAGKTRQLHVKE